MRRISFVFLAAALAAVMSTPVRAIEGAALAGPIGGTDIRVARYPPPGLYGGLALLHIEAYDFVDGSGNRIPGTDHARLYANVAGPFFAYVPDIDVLGGSVGMLASLPYGEECGRIFNTMARKCRSGFGDPYVEVGWSRSFGHLRASSDPGAYPVFQGLSIALGLGTVIPVGDYNAFDANVQGISMGNNLWIVAPSLAVTYTTPPLIADGTELSAKIYWNMYGKNPDTQYQTGDLINIDFALTERIGRFQIGVAGFYAFQVQDDTLFGASVPPDGRRAKILNVGGIVSYDLPAHGMLFKVKALSTVHTANMPTSPGVVFSLVKKLW
jgi:hypothetical protein